MIATFACRLYIAFIGSRTFELVSTTHELDILLIFSEEFT